MRLLGNPGRSSGGGGWDRLYIAALHIDGFRGWHPMLRSSAFRWRSEQAIGRDFQRHCQALNNECCGIAYASLNTAHIGAV